MWIGSRGRCLSFFRLFGCDDVYGFLFFKEISCNFYNHMGQWFLSFEGASQFFIMLHLIIIRVSLSFMRHLPFSVFHLMIVKIFVWYHSCFCFELSVYVHLIVSYLTCSVIMFLPLCPCYFYIWLPQTFIWRGMEVIVDRFSVQ